MTKLPTSAEGLQKALADVLFEDLTRMSLM